MVEPDSRTTVRNVYAICTLWLSRDMHACMYAICIKAPMFNVRQSDNILKPKKRRGNVTNVEITEL